MATLLNNLPLTSDPCWVSLSAAVGAVTDEPGGTLTIDSEDLLVVAGAGTRSLFCSRGTPATHTVGTDVSYSAPSGGSQTLEQTLANGNATGENAIVMPMGTIDGTTDNAIIQIFARTNNGSHGAQFEVDPGETNGPGLGGDAYLQGGSGTAGDGGSVHLAGGVSDGGNHGNVIVDFGSLLVILNIPTSDPGVSGAVYSDGAAGSGSPVALKISGG